MKKTRRIKWIAIVLSVVLIGMMYPHITVYGETDKQDDMSMTESYTSESLTDTQKFVTRLYEMCLGRKADADGLKYWDHLLTTKQTSGAAVARNFVFSKEYASKRTSNERYVEMLYTVFMNREADVSGKNYWIGCMDQGLSREYVFCGFAMSKEFSEICTKYGINRGNVASSQMRDKNPALTRFVNRMYTQALERPGEESGLNYWCELLINKKVLPIVMAENFIFSKEFLSKNLSDSEYIKVLYRTFLGREYDQAGLDAWMKKLKNGSSRKDIMMGFASSVEFNNIMAEAGLADFIGARYKYSVKVLNKNTLYNNTDIVLYIKTDNPDKSTITVSGYSKQITKRQYSDIHYSEKDVSEFLEAVSGGYLATISCNIAGTNEIIISEKAPDGKTYKTCTYRLDLTEYKAAEDTWCDEVIKKVATSSMSDKEKMDALCNYVRTNFTYLPNDGKDNLELVCYTGAYWDVKKIDCNTATQIMCKFADKLGLKSTVGKAGDLDYQWAVVTIDGNKYVYDACPLTSTGLIKKWEYIL